MDFEAARSMPCSGACAAIVTCNRGQLSTIYQLRKARSTARGSGLESRKLKEEDEEAPGEQLHTVTVSSPKELKLKDEYELRSGR